jgi:hypothetical protein
MQACPPRNSEADCFAITLAGELWTCAAVTITARQQTIAISPKTSVIKNWNYVQRK